MKFKKIFCLVILIAMIAGCANKPEIAFSPDPIPTVIKAPAPATLTISVPVYIPKLAEKIEELEEEPVEIEKPKINPEELEMLACVIYQEAGGDACCDDCRRRVADVVLNRVESDRYPDTMYEVLTQRAQYGRLHWTGIKWPDRAGREVEAGAVERAYRIAEEVLNGQHSELYGEGYIFQAEFSQSDDSIVCCDIYFGR